MLDFDKDTALASTEGMAALATLLSMRQCKAALEAWSVSTADLVRSSLFSAMVVNYSRGFELVTADRAKGISRSFSVRDLRRNEHFRSDLHQLLLKLRNDQVAHVGFDGNDLTLAYMTINATPDADSAAAGVEEFTMHRGSIARVSFPIGPRDEKDVSELLLHFEAIEQLATTRLSQAILEHEVGVLQKFAADPVGTAADSRTYHTVSARVPRNALLFAEASDFEVSLARSPPGLPLEFGQFHYSVILQPSGRVDLREVYSARSERDPSAAQPNVPATP